MGCVVPGLVSIHYNLSESWVKKAVYYLIDKQNDDGGFGETPFSYNNPKEYNGKGNAYC